MASPANNLVHGIFHECFTEKEKISELERAKEEEARLEKEKAAKEKKEEEEGVAKLYNRSVLVIPEEDGYIGCSIRG